MIHTQDDPAVCKGGTGRFLLAHDDWTVHEMVMDKDKIKWLWDQMSRYRTLFSDLTRGKENNFAALLSLPDSFWMEVLDTEKNIVGIVYMTNMAQVIDCDIHLIFFDRKPRAKTELCKQIARWIFKEMGYHRLTATIPVIYYATGRLAEGIGFKLEGRKRQSQLMGHKWVDEVIYGLLYNEV